MSSTQKQCLDFGHVDLMLFELLVKRAARDAEPLGGLLDAAAFFLKDAFDVLLFELESVSRESRNGEPTCVCPSK